MTVLHPRTGHVAGLIEADARAAGNRWTATPGKNTSPMRGTGMSGGLPD